jgi:predicted dehydrogenase
MTRARVPAPVSVLVVAIGGYGYYYLRTLLDEVDPARAVLAGVVDPEARQSRAWPEVEARGVPVCSAVDEYFAAGHHADLAVVVSPIQHHVPQSSAALAAGAHVLCDKPLGATIQEAIELSSAGARTGRSVLIGYQWSYSAAIQALKHDILSGAFGRPRRFSALCCWPRDEAYYRRNQWAGRLRDPQSGRWVLDSPANNAMAHSLHNLLYLAGGGTTASARPERVQAEMYRVYDIESCDTTICRVRTREVPEILFYASHSTQAAIEPRFSLDFDEATVVFDEQPRTIVATDRAGRRKEYGAPDDTPQFKKLFDAIDMAGHARLEPCATGTEALCGPEAATAQTLTVNGMHESVRDIPSFPAALVDGRAPGRRFVPGLDELLRRCYERGEMPHEAGADWAVAGREVELANYRFFPAGERTR